MTRPAGDIQLVRALWEQGYNKLQISRLSGIPRATIRDWLAAGVDVSLARPAVEHDWQEKILEAHPDEVLKGLIHSDGCRCINRIVSHGRPYAYARYLFSNQSTDIIGICTRCLDLLWVEWRMNRPNSVSIARRASVAALDGFIGPKT